MDPKTRLILFKMVNNSFLQSVNGEIAIGKEAVVLHAEGINSIIVFDSKTEKNGLTTNKCSSHKSKTW